MRKTSGLLKHWWLILCLLALVLSACSQGGSGDNRPTPTLHATQGYTLASGGSCVALGQHPQPPYANVRVSHDSYPAHSEPMLAENPRNALNLVGGTKFFTNLAKYQFQIGYFYSFDGGCTWTDGGVLPGFQQKFTLTSDITFAFGAHNDVYAAVLYEARPGMSGIAVSTSTDGGKTFGQPVSVFESVENQVFNDKPWITVDQTNGPRKSNIYVVWSYDHNGNCGNGNLCSEELGFSRSTDGGKTFSPVKQVEGNALFCTNPATGRPANSIRCDAVQGAIPVVEPDGTLAVATPYIDLMSGNIPTRLMITTSPNGGDTWTTPVAIAIISDIDGYFPPERYRNISLPAFACDPQTGQLYITWSDKATGDADILFSTSTDRGQTWSAPLRVNDDAQHSGANHFQPQMAVAPNGTVSIAFFDTRLDATHKMIDVYLAQSIDHGATFLKNERITTQSWDPAVGAPTHEYPSHYTGESPGFAGDSHFVHPFWNDTRTDAQEIFTAAIPSA